MRQQHKYVVSAAKNFTTIWAGQPFEVMQQPIVTLPGAAIVS